MANREQEKAVPRAGSRRRVVGKTGQSTVPPAAGAREQFEEILNLIIGSLKRNPEGRFSVNDLARMVDLYKQVSDEAPKRIVVEWIDPCEQTNSRGG